MRASCDQELGEVASDATRSLWMRVSIRFLSSRRESSSGLGATYTNDGDFLDSIDEARRLIFGIFGRHVEVLYPSHQKNN